MLRSEYPSLPFRWAGSIRALQKRPDTRKCAGTCAYPEIGSTLGIWELGPSEGQLGRRITGGS